MEIKMEYQEIPQFVLERLEISGIIADHIIEELIKKGYDIERVPTHSNNLRSDGRYGSVNLIVNHFIRKKKFLFLKRKRKRLICGVHIFHNKVEISGPTYPERYGKFDIKNPKHACS